MSGNRVRVALRIGVRVALVGAAALAVLLGATWVEVRRPIDLPPPTGAFAVGRITADWTNPAATDDVEPPARPRQLAAWIWYPAVPAPGAMPAPYLPPRWQDAWTGALVRPLRLFVRRSPGRVGTHAVGDAPVAPAPGPFPVVMLRAGGSALTADFTTLAEDLASHGYVVAGIDAPWRSMVFVRPDGSVVHRAAAFNVEVAGNDLAHPVIARVLALWVADTAFAVDMLTRLNADAASVLAGRLDLARLGMVGHSFGGATALEFCRVDGRCHAAIDLDGIPFGDVVAGGLAAPAMFVLSDHSADPGGPSAEVLARVRAIHGRLPAGRRASLEIRGANHFSFSDQVVLNSRIVMRLGQAATGLSLDGRRGLRTAADLVHAFFDVQLRGVPAATFDETVARHAEVRPGPQ